MTTNWWDLPEENEPVPWTLADIYNDLGTVTDVAKDLNITHVRIVEWLKRAERLKPPQPVRVLGGTKVYSIQEWRDWFHNWTKDRRPGTKWSTEAKPYTPPPKRAAYGSQQLSTVFREAATGGRTAD